MKLLARHIYNYARSVISPKSWGEAYVGGGDLKEVGQEFRRHFVSAGLKPHHDVLDIGCGIGRMAMPLTEYLTGSYTGIDISKKAIKYCERQIKKDNFRFIHAGLYNQTYNLSGGSSARYRLPFEDRSFDFVFLTSVFTHLLKEEVQNYVTEISRVLRPGSICFATWFLLQDIEEMKISMKPYDDVSRVHSANEPTAAIAYDPAFVRDLYAKNQLTIQNTYPGNWARSQGLTWQDIVVATS